MSAVDDYLEAVVAAGAGRSASEVVLWPRTPMEDRRLDDVIAQRVGASDGDLANPRSRSARVVAVLEALDDAGLIDSAPSVIDIACGDARILTAVRESMPQARCDGVDLAIGTFASHTRAQDAGVRLWRVLLQDLFQRPAPVPFEVAIMLNTYRGWENADLRPEEADLPRQADAWFDASARVVVMTVDRRQVGAWRRRGYLALDCGPGEDDSRLVCFTREPPGLRFRLAARRIRQAANARPPG